MAGKGPAPKDPSTRARTNKPAIPPTRMKAAPGRQPKLPVRMFRNEDGRMVRVAWPKITRGWWAAWGRSQISAGWTETDWFTALEIALLHAEFWEGDTKVAPELRQRIAKIGGYPDDRKRQGFFDAKDEPAVPVAAPVPTGARARRGGLHAVPDLKVSGG